MVKQLFLLTEREVSLNAETGLTLSFYTSSVLLTLQGLSICDLKELVLSGHGTSLTQTCCCGSGSESYFSCFFFSFFEFIVVYQPELTLVGIDPTMFLVRAGCKAVRIFLFIAVQC